MAGSKCTDCMQCVHVCWCVWLQVCFGISLKNQSNREKLLPSRSQRRADLHMHLSFKTTVNESHLIISPERICNSVGLDYGIAAFVKNLWVWIPWIVIPPEMRVDSIWSWLRRAQRGSTGFLNDNIVMHQCHTIAVVLDHYRVVKVQWWPNHSMCEEICNQRMNTLFHGRFKQAVQLI